MTLIGFIRHGVTDWNREGRAQGQFDVPLNQEGMEQAKRLAGRMAGESWDSIYSSDLSRARVTAELVASAMGKPITRLDTRLREKSHGLLDGTTPEERVARWGEQWAQLDFEEETKEQILTRSLSFLKEIEAAYPKGRILIVSHGAWIRTTLEALVPDLSIKPLENTSLSIVKKKAHGWECILYNCSKHLEKDEASA